MTKEEILSKVNEIAKVISRDNLNRYIKNHYPELHSEIHERTKELDKFDVPEKRNKRISLYERLYCIEHDLSDRPKCKLCGERYVNGFIKHENKYRKWCCPSCQVSDPDTQKKISSTKLEKYGDSNFMNIEQAKITRMERYGGWNAKDFKEKSKKTRLERYGDENYRNPDKAKETKLKRYGKSGFNNTAKISQTKQMRYGDAKYNNRPKFKESLARNPLATEHKTIAIKNRSFDIIMARCKDYKPLFTRDEYINNRIPHKKWLWQHKNCGHIFEAEYASGSLVTYCPKCYSNATVSSKSEDELFNYIRTIYSGEILHRNYGNRKLLSGNREIDIILPELKLCIEFDGLYFHSTKFRERNFHINKTMECEELGYRLIHVFEDEWLGRRDIVKSRIRHAISNNKRRIYARNCVVEEIDDSTKNLFLTKYHMLGTDKSKIRYGLKYRGHLVAVMTFIKARFAKDFQWELSRYATVANFVVVGGMGKLVKHFEKSIRPTSIGSYVDIRWGNGTSFEKIGFNLIRRTKPNYFYVYYARRVSRLDYKAIYKSDSFLRNKKKIYDCGNLVFVKTYPENEKTGK